MQYQTQIMVILGRQGREAKIISLSILEALVSVIKSWYVT